MNLCYSRSPSGKDLWYRDYEESETVAAGPDLYTTLNPNNARVIVSAMEQDSIVAACSDLMVEDALATDDPEVMAVAMLDVQEHPGRSGFRYLTPLDRLHMSIQLQWQQPGFRFSRSYMHELRGSGVLERHPLTPYAMFLGLDPVYCVMAAAMWVDPVRWDVVSGNEGLSQRLMDYNLGLEGPSPAMYNHLTQRQPLSVINDLSYCSRLRGWLLLHGCWSAGLSNALKNSGSRLNLLYRQVVDAVHHGQGRLLDFDRTVHIIMTQTVTHYLIAHHKSLVRGSTFLYCEDGHLSLTAFPDLADAYILHFSNLQCL